MRHSVDEWLASFADEMPSRWNDRPAPVLPVGVDEWLAQHADELPPLPPVRPIERRESLAGERQRRTSAQRQILFERDAWMCGLCGGLTEPRSTASHPYVVAVLDHIVPLRPYDQSQKPGLDIDSNLQCAHWLCNASKKNHAGWKAKIIINPQVRP